MSDVIIIGGGAAGMLCAIGAMKAGKSVTIVEKNEKLGKKLFITGKGRCNITNIADRDEFFENIMRNSQFLYSSFSLFNNYDVMNLIEDNGVKTKVERGGRVFPQSDKSSDVIKAFERELKKCACKIYLKTTVKDIIVEDNKVCGVVTNKGKILAESVVVCTGGKSYTSTGSTGDGYEFAKKLGHSVTPLTPSLIPMNCKDDFLDELQGLTLKNVALICNYNNKCVYKDQGEMMFSHFGITGPLVLTLSAVLGDVDFNKVELYIDLKPALDEETLDKRLLRDFENTKNKALKNAIDGLLPKSLIPVFLKKCKEQGVNIDAQVNSVTKKERHTLINVLKKFTVTPVGYRDLDYAIITRGGVNIKEVNPKTLESKLVNGLYFAGEVLDLDAKTGGFNLQIAFSTGYSAGINC